MRTLRTSLRDKGDGLPGAGSGDVGGEENGVAEKFNRKSPKFLFPITVNSYNHILSSVVLNFNTTV